MRSKFMMWGSILAGVSIASSGLAVPTATYVKTIDLAAFAAPTSNFPTGVDFYNGSVYYVTFNNQRLFRVDNPLTGSPSQTQMKDFSASVVWPAGRGMLGLNTNKTNGDIYVAGENGTVGVVGVYSNAGAENYLSNAAPRYTAIDRFGTTSTAFAANLLASSAMRQIDISTNPPTQTAQAAAAAAPYNANLRDLVTVGNRVYYSRNGTTADGYARYDAVVANTLAGATATGIYQTTGTNTVSAMGIGYFKDGATDYVLVPDLSGRVVRLVNAATNTVDLTIDHPVFTVGGLRDAATGVIAGNTYLFITRAGVTPPAGDSIDIFQLNGVTASVSDWQMY